MHFTLLLTALLGVSAPAETPVGNRAGFFAPVG